MRDLLGRFVEGNIKERFLKYVRKNDYCWQWTGNQLPNGYGRFWFKGKGRLAHRIAYLLFKGKIPTGLLVCHTCDNRMCMNPDHLWLGTYGDNNRDRNQKGRGVDNRGEKSGHAKITNKEAEHIRMVYNAGGITQKELAERFGFGQSQVSRIINNEIYERT